MIVWRIKHLALLGRRYPEIPCDIIFSKQEWASAFISNKKTSKVPPLLKEAMNMVGALVGYVKTKSNPYPGFELLWRWLWRLFDIEWGIRIANEYF